MSGICIGQACRESEAVEDHMSYITTLIVLVSMAMSLGLCLSLCIMQHSSKYGKSIEMQINVDRNNDRTRLYPAVQLDEQEQIDFEF